MARIVKLSSASNAGLPTLAPQLTFCTQLPSHVVRCMAGSHEWSPDMLVMLAGALRRVACPLGEQHMVLCISTFTACVAGANIVQQLAESGCMSSQVSVFRWVPSHYVTMRLLPPFCGFGRRARGRGGSRPSAPGCARGPTASGPSCGAPRRSRRCWPAGGRLPPPPREEGAGWSRRPTTPASRRHGPPRPPGTRADECAALARRRGAENHPAALPGSLLLHLLLTGAHSTAPL